MIHDNLFKDKKELAKYISDEIYKVLKKYDYKRKGNDFYIDKGELGCVINVQKARFPGKDEEDFTLNWGICFPMCAYFYGYELPSSPRFSDCLFGNRVAMLKDKKDSWWKLYTNSTQNDVDRVLADVEYCLQEYAIPFLEKINTIHDSIMILQAIEDGCNFYTFSPNHPNPKPFKAILNLFAKDKVKACEIMDQIICCKASAKISGYQASMIRLKEKIEHFDPTKYKNSY